MQILQFLLKPWLYIPRTSNTNNWENSSLRELKEWPVLRPLRPCSCPSLEGYMGLRKAVILMLQFITRKEIKTRKGKRCMGQSPGKPGTSFQVSSPSRVTWTCLILSARRYKPVQSAANQKLTRALVPRILIGRSDTLAGSNYMVSLALLLN